MHIPMLYVLGVYYIYMVSGPNFEFTKISVQSWKSYIVHRYSFSKCLSKFVTENVNAEGARLREQANNLPPFLVPNTDVSIKCIGCPNLLYGAK